MSHNRNGHPSRNDGLRRRVLDLIDSTYGGSVRAAAAAIRVPQRTLARLVSGDEAKRAPRVDLLATIAEHFGTSIEWILTGEGAAPTGPSELLPWPQVQRWYALLEDIGLPAEVELEWRQLPFGVAGAQQHLHTGDESRPHTRTPELITAMAREVSGWTTALEEWRERDGDKLMRQKMSKPRAINAARLGFSWYGLVLLAHDEYGPVLEAMLEATADQHGRRGKAARAAYVSGAF